MKFFLLSINIFLNTSLSFAQKVDGSLYAFNADWKPVDDINKAAYFMHKVKANDTTFFCRFYQTKGPMVLWETYKDDKLSIAHGVFAWYNKNGTLDSMGTYFNDYKHKKWQYHIDDSSKPKIEEEFEYGVFIKGINNETKRVYWANGTKTDLQSNDDDTVDANGQKIIRSAAKFKNGDIAEWTKYLSKNLNTPERFMQISGPQSKGTVGIEFFVNKEGKIDNVFIFKSCEWSADLEAMRAVKSSPDWTPAYQNGKNVIYRHRQSITFQVGH